MTGSADRELTIGSGGADASPGDVGSSGPRRSGLVQERSRKTRRDLVDAALRLWSARGFDAGIDETTVEEIAKEAGVTKGTFYFHFAHKEDILLEVGFGTSQAMFKEASAALATDDRVEEVLERLLTSLARRISDSPAPRWPARWPSSPAARCTPAGSPPMSASDSNAPSPLCSSTPNSQVNFRPTPTRASWVRS